jgi:hypothetical protein
MSKKDARRVWRSLQKSGQQPAVTAGDVHNGAIVGEVVYGRHCVDSQFREVGHGLVEDF